MRADGSWARSVITAYECGRIFDTPTWSANGKYLLFGVDSHFFDDPRSTAVHRVDLTGEYFRPVTDATPPFPDLCQIYNAP